MAKAKTPASKSTGKSDKTSDNSAALTESVQIIERVDKEAQAKIKVLTEEMAEIRDALVVREPKAPKNCDAVQSRDVTKPAKSAESVGGTVYSGGRFFRN